MNRTHSYYATIISLKPSGENNFSVTVLSKELGISYATLYGGPKSKLKSLVSLWNSGILYLYENPDKKQAKITDFDVKNFHESFSKNLFKTYAANLAAELAIKTNCAGSNEECYRIISGFLDGMDLCNEEQSRLGLIRFLWRYIGLLGVQPEVKHCNMCSCNLENSYYNDLNNIFYCENCVKEKAGSLSDSGNAGHLYKLQKEAINYLDSISNLSPKEVRNIVISKESYEEIRIIMFKMLENSIGQKINTFKTGEGIL